MNNIIAYLKSLTNEERLIIDAILFEIPESLRRINPATINPDICQARIMINPQTCRKITGGTIQIFKEKQCTREKKHGELCKQCNTKKNKLSDCLESNKSKNGWNGKIIEEPPYFSHMIDTEWYNDNYKYTIFHPVQIQIQEPVPVPVPVPVPEPVPVPVPEPEPMSFPVPVPVQIQIHPQQSMSSTPIPTYIKEKTD